MHRDVKPDNVMLTKDFRCKLADFESCWVVKPNTDSPFGTSAYMAPEVWEGVYTEKADIFSFSIITWQLLTREIPYKTKQLNKIIDETLKGYRPEIPKITHTCETSKGECDCFGESVIHPFIPLMQQGWAQNPIQRPSATAIHLRLTELFQERERRKNAE
jgi:serine/threonine protein kinase